MNIFGNRALQSLRRMYLMGFLLHYGKNIQSVLMFPMICVRNYIMNMKKSDALYGKIILTLVKMGKIKLMGIKYVPVLQEPC